MIMAGRGRRLDDIFDQSKKVNPSAALVDKPAFDIQTLTKYINEINVAKFNLPLFNVLKSSFSQMCTTKENLQNVISELHYKALSDKDFGEKLVILLKIFFGTAVNGISIRSVCLNVLQSEFVQKETILQSNKPRFINSVILLGNYYRMTSVTNEPYHILGSALLEYYEMLLKGDAEDLEVLATQIGLNNSTFLIDSPENIKKYELLQQNMRNTLISSNLSQLSRCWILLIIDLISHESEGISGALKDFYVTNLGDAYTKLEAFINAPYRKVKMSNNSLSNHSTETSNNSTKEEFTKNVDKGELFETFVDLNITKSSNDESKNQRKASSQFGRNRRGENQKWQNFDKSASNKKGSIKSEHDDRFEKDENYYLTQSPRISKKENVEKNKSSWDFDKTKTKLGVDKSSNQK